MNLESKDEKERLANDKRTQKLQMTHVAHLVQVSGDDSH